MKIEIDESADAVYLYLNEVPVAKSKIIQPGVSYDFDDDGNVMGIEVIHARSWFGDLSSLTPENMLGAFMAKQMGTPSAPAPRNVPTDDLLAGIDEAQRTLDKVRAYYKRDDLKTARSV